MVGLHQVKLTKLEKSLSLADSLGKTQAIAQELRRVEDKLGKARFFQETFLLADISVEVVLEMSFLTLSNADT